MSYTLNLNKLIKDLRGPKGLAALTEEVAKLKSEIESEVGRIRGSVEPAAQKRLKVIQTRINGLRSQWEKRQNQLEKEVENSLKAMRKAAKDAEGKLQKAIKTKGKAGTKKAAKTSKKVAKKTSKKTSKKASV